jgi:hypothetical protein
MTIPDANGSGSAAGASDTTFIVSLWRRGPKMRAALLLPVVALVIVAGALYEKPAHTYHVGVNQAVWASDVKIALAERVPVGPIMPTGSLRDLPGVGEIASVIVDRSASGNKVTVLFLTSVGVNEAGLAYLKGFPPPQDSCSVHLSGPWWQIAPLNTTTMGCARGFHDNGGG